MDAPSTASSLFSTLTSRFNQSTKTKTITLAAVICLSGVTAYKLFSNKSSSSERSSTEDKKQRGKQAGVDLVFFQRLHQIFLIIMKKQEMVIFLILTGLLIARTMLSIVIAEIVGTNAEFLVGRKWKELAQGIFKFALITIPASFVNSYLKFFTAILALRIRKRLSETINDEYLSGVNFYRACNLGGENRIDNADQRVTTDIARFSESISELYTTLFKPILDVTLFTYKLATVTGWPGPAIMFSYFLFSGIVKREIMPSFGKMVAKESELEGIYRTAHQRLITNSEEIAFYDGSSREKTIINRAFDLLYAHIYSVRYKRSFVGVFDGLLVKYWASICGYIALTVPIYFDLKGNKDKTTSELTRDYIRSGQYMGNLTVAVGDLVLVGNKLTTIAGHTSRVSELLEQVRHLKSIGTEPFQMREDDEKQFHYGTQSTDSVKLWLPVWKERCDRLRQGRLAAVSGPTSIQKGGGRYLTGEDIQFADVDIVSPEGKLLVRNLNVHVKRGQHVMITGPNGAGKSSMFRIIGELWPLHCGTVTKPGKEDILFVPQKPYLVLGTLRDQIIYPDSHEEMKKKNVTDDDLSHLLAIVDPSGIILKNWAFDDEKDWFHAFSGGQKQRVAMARLFYHRPQFAILDECTSAVSDEVEDKIYETCSQLGITLFTVSHRKYLRKYHDFLLKFEGRDGIWSWVPVSKTEKS